MTEFKNDVTTLADDIGHVLTKITPIVITFICVLGIIQVKNLPKGSQSIAIQAIIAINSVGIIGNTRKEEHKKNVHDNTGNN